MPQTKRLLVIGGGAAGFFAAINAKEKNPNLEVIIFEGSRTGLTKVRISGGGRCNVTHSCFEIDRLLKNYPRGQKELNGPLHRFQPKDTIRWFNQRGIELKTETDGRVFPSTDQSQTIINCFLNEVTRVGVKVDYENRVTDIKKENSQFTVRGASKHQQWEEKFDFVLIATGSHPSGFRLAQNLGHSITPLVPSLFTFHISDSELNKLTGISVPDAEVGVNVGAKNIFYRGPLLIVHWGISGPAVLKLSAFVARELHASNYRCSVIIRFLLQSEEEVFHLILKQKEKNSSSKIINRPGIDLPSRLVELLIKRAEIDLNCRWADLSKEKARRLAKLSTCFETEMTGKSTYKNEFVTCGGVSLTEINFKTMESKICAGLYFAGEVLDIDGITGGFNFQNAWTGAWLVSEALQNY